MTTHGRATHAAPPAPRRRRGSVGSVYVAAFAACAVAALVAPAAHADPLRQCAAAPAPTAVQQDKLLRLAALVRAELDRSGARAAIVARSGLDLARFGARYSHAGVSLRDSGHGRWAVRQLYYACDEQRPRIFDQGLPGFVFGMHDAAHGYVSVLLLPADEEARLERSALDDAAALSLLGARYSANAYAFGDRYQNCNQWLAELLALAWGTLRPAGAPRRAAQQWLQLNGYVPTVFDVGALWMVAGAAVPWLHVDDHPPVDRERATFHVSMPESIADFVRRRLPAAQRIEVCHDETRFVVRRGWRPIGEGCVPAPGDDVVALDGGG